MSTKKKQSPDSIIREIKRKTRRKFTAEEKILILWKDADPGIAEVEDARKKLVGLKNQ